MSERFIVCLGRKYGSGGHNIGRKLAERLGVKCYDRQLVELASKEIGLSDEVLSGVDERPMTGFLGKLAMDTYSYGYYSMIPEEEPINERVFSVQQRVIKELAKNESCVIVGRCADYALADDSDMLSVFVDAPLDYRIKVIMNRCNEDAKNAEKLIHKVDKRRAKYYYSYTDKKWGELENYHLTFDSSRIGEDQSAEVIISYLKGMNKI